MSTASTTLSGLSGGVRYSYVVATLTSAGEGDRSTALSASTSPPAPTDLDSVSQTTSSISLSWTAPVVTSGEAVTAYTLFIDDGAGGAIDTTVTSCTGEALLTTCTATGLTGGTSYRFEVLAESNARDSDRSATLTQATSPAAVGAITFGTVTMTSTVLTWSAPSGDAPTGYIVYRDDGDGATPSIVAYDGTDDTATTATVTGLSGGTLYSYIVESYSGAGVGDVSAVATQSTSPATPLDLSSTSQTTTSISLSWSSSVVQTGGGAITNYRVYRNDGDGGAVSSTHEWEGSATSASLTVSGGTLYKFVVSAVSAVGESEPSTELSQSSAPGAPAAPTSTHQTSTSISLSWNAPASDSSSGDDATRYRVYDVGGAAPTVPVYDGESTVYEQTGLTAGTEYSYKVSALSAAGEGDKSDVLDQYTAPDAATELVASDQTTDSIKLDWTAPTVPSATPVLGYKVYELSLIHI